MIYLHENGVTVVASEDAKRGKVYELNGEEYYIARGVADIKRIVESGEYPLNRVVTSKLTTLNALFQIRGGYDQSAIIPDEFNDDITNWDTSNVVSMEEVFSGWQEFNQDISYWDTSKVESMHGMFKSSKYQGSYYLGETSFNQDISKWDVSKVKNMSEMFLGASSFNQDISNWDVSNVENMDHMFSGAISFNQPIGNWDTGKVESMRGMFSDIVSIGIVAFVGTFEYGRAGSTSFNQPIGNWDVSNVKDMADMFSGATSFNQDISTWDVSNIRDMSNMFSGGRIDGLKDDWSSGILISKSSRESGSACMGNNPTSFNQPIGNWDVSNVENMYRMFSGATSFNQPIGDWKVSNVKNMSEMFRGATSFNQDLNGWHADIATLVKGMFYGATSFNSPIGNWHVESISDMENMFREAFSFNQDISGWDVSNVTQMKGIFQDATSFNQNISKWQLNEKLPKSRTMFKGANAFNIKEYNPFLNKEVKKRVVDTSTANLSSEDKKTITKIKKLLVERDYDKIDLGLELLISLNNLDLFESLLHDCKIGPGPFAITRNKFFTGSGPAQPYLDYALVKIIANAPQNAKIDDSLLIKNIFSPEIRELRFHDKIGNNQLRNFMLKSIDKFTSLTSLEVHLNTDTAHVGLEKFVDNNITELKVYGSPSSLKWLKNFSQLNVLLFYAESDFEEEYENFKHLKNLEDLTFNAYPSRYENLDFLSELKKIKRLCLKINHSSYASVDVKLKNINFLNELHELEELEISSLYDFMILDSLSLSEKLNKLSISVNSDVDVDFLLSCKQIKELTLKLSEDLDLQVLKNCESLESLEVLGFSNLHLYGSVSDIDGLEGLSNLKTISIGGGYRSPSFSISGIDEGNLMRELNSSISTSPTITKSNVRIEEEHVNEIRDLIYYKGRPFNGIIFYEREGLLFYEYEVVNGIKDGIYREFYASSSSALEEEKITNKIKYDAKFQNNDFINVTGFYNENFDNVLEGQECVPNTMLEFNDSQFYYENNVFTGFCFLEIETTSPSVGFGNRSELFNQSLFDLVCNSNQNPLEHNHQQFRKGKVSLILNIKNGIITKDIFVATKSKYAKISIVDEYDFSRLSDEEQLAYKDLPEETLHRLYIYSSSFTRGNAKHPLSQIPVISTIDNSTLINSLNGKSIVVTGVFANHSRDELKKIIESNGGKSSSSVTKNTSFILAGSKMGPNKKLKADELNINIIGEDEFIETYASVTKNQKQSEYVTFLSLIDDLEKNINNSHDSKPKVVNRPKLSSADKKTFSEIKKQINSRDYDKIDEAVKKLLSLNNPELFETLLDGCEIHTTSDGYTKLIRNSFFTGSSPAQPFLNYALFCLIAHAPHDAEIDDSIVQNKMSTMDMSLFFNKNDALAKSLPLNNFSSLSSLSMKLDIFTEMNKGANKLVKRDEWFINDNIIDLNLEETNGSLKWFKNFTQLKSLKFNFSFYPVEHLESFEYLENLEELELNKINYQQEITNLDFLKKCKKAQEITIKYIYFIYRRYGVKKHRCY